MASASIFLCRAFDVVATQPTDAGIRGRVRGETRNLRWMRDRGDVCIDAETHCHCLALLISCCWKESMTLVFLALSWGSFHSPTQLISVVLTILSARINN